MRKILLTMLMLLGSVAGAQAHEHRDVKGGYVFVVGFLNEPAFSEQMNGLDLRISKDGVPVEGLEKTLKAAVRFQDKVQELELPLRTRYKQPGAYAGYFLPVSAGNYEFEITGTIDGRAVNEIFRSGNGFKGVEDSESLRFPGKSKI